MCGYWAQPTWQDVSISILVLFLISCHQLILLTYLYLKIYSQKDLNFLSVWQTWKNTKSLHNLNSIYFSCFYKGNRVQNEEIYTNLKNITQTWSAGLRDFPALLSASWIQNTLYIALHCSWTYLSPKPSYWQFPSGHHLSSGNMSGMVKYKLNKYKIRQTFIATT